MGVYRKLVAIIGMTVMGVTTFLIRYISFGYGIPLNQKIIAPFFARVILFFQGVSVEVNINHLSENQTYCYFFNHNSFLDLFLVPLIKLKNTRFIISEVVKQVIPLHLCNLGVNVLYIPDSDKTEERIEFFKQVSKDLSEDKYSVICSPEGRHAFIKGISPFNKGVFHMALASGKPIHNLFFDIKADKSPDNIASIKSGKIKISTMNIIQTSDWKIDEVEEYIASTYKLFLERYREAHGDYGDSKVEA